jgi:drug/metabolite transporter (DMT)-like permease
MGVRSFKIAGVNQVAQNRTISPLLALFFGILAVSTASIFIRYAQANAPSLVIAAYRLSLAALGLAPFAWTRRRDELVALTPRDLLLALLSGFFLALHFASWITSLEFTTVASSVVLVTTTPLWVGLFSPFILKESLRRVVALGLGLALVGSTIVGLSDVCSWSLVGLVCPSWAQLLRGRAFMGDLLALAGAIMAACYLMIGRSLRSRMSLLSYIFLVYGMAACVLIAAVLVRRQNPLGYPPLTYLWFALLAIVPQLIGHTTFNWTLRYLSAAYVSISLLGEPVGSTILAYIFLGETPTALKVFGAILILVGIYVASRSEVQDLQPID